MIQQINILSTITLILLNVIQSQTAPVKDLHKHPPRVWALTHGKVHTEPGTILDNATIVLRNGIIEAVGVAVKIPQDATEIDLNNNHVYAGFIESWLGVSVKDTTHASRDHWNPQVHADQIAFDAFSPTEKELTDLRNLGFTNAHIVLSDGIFRGQSSLVHLGSNPQVLSNSIGQILDFKYGGRGSDEYPNSLLGCIALIRQTLLDAGWYRSAKEILAKHPEGNEPIEEDLSLEALANALKQEIPFIFNTKDELVALRASAIAREYNLTLWLKGSGYEYRRLNAISELNPFIILPLDYPGKPEVSNPYQALQYNTEQLKHWDMAPDNAIHLSAEKIALAFTTNGLKEKATFRKNLISTVTRGLPREAALAALTTVPAEKMGVGDVLGKIKEKYLANLVVVDGDYFDQDSEVRAVWISGDEYQVNLPPRVEFAGKWSFRIEQDTLALIIAKKMSKYSGTFEFDSVTKALDHLVVDDDRVSWTCQLDSLETTRYMGHLTANQATGFAVKVRGGSIPWIAVHVDLEEKKPEEKKTRAAASDLVVVYPEGAFGYEALPEKPYAVLVDEATIWTCGPKGILQDWDILFIDGKVKKIARDIAVPRGSAIVIDGQGKHITPGLIDCHSHTAAASINEGTQSVTAEVRIQDVIDSDDIALYRQLAGGLTIANVLHGSANAIGGQNAVIKLRWGRPPAELIYRKAPPGIKFALGENVKQSNWGDKHTKRYPQTRMGVEQVIRDAFFAAQDYRKRWNTYERNSKLRRTKIPPRRDLELEALVEILEGTRLVHCHSYRQDEILMLTRVAEDFDFTVGTFQHVLEGYKVADRIADHGARASLFSDWWAYKFEVIDAIPYAGTLMTNVGALVSYNSDSDELARRLNTEAAKAVKYGGMSEEDALKLVTINPARQLMIDQWVGSLEVGKDADFVIWSDHPLSTYAKCEQTWIDGRLYFSIEQDWKLRQRDAQLRNDLIQKILNTKEDNGSPMAPAAQERPYSCFQIVNTQLMEGGEK